MTEKSNEPSPARKGRNSGKKGSKRAASTKSRGGSREGAGRPEFRPSLEQRQTVEEMIYCGESKEIVARAIGIDVDTLSKHFANELEDGYAQRRREISQLLFKEARGGNVSAIRRLEEIGRVVGAAGSAGDKTEKAPKLGKKEEQQQAARAVGGKYSPPAAPRLAIDNTK